MPASDFDDLKLFTIKSVCSLLDMHEREVYRRIYAGELQRVKIGAMTRIPLSSLRAFVQRLKDEAAA